MRSVRLEVLHVTDCPNLTPMLERLRRATGLPVTTRAVDTDADAARFGMAGSPTLLIDGVDPFNTTPPLSQASRADQAGELGPAILGAAAAECVCSVTCRLYRDEAGRIVPAPSVEQLRAAIIAASQPQANHAMQLKAQPNTPAGVLSAWRTRALPLEPVEKAAHRAILSSFATTGRAPTEAELGAAVATAADGRTATEVLQALHTVDAIRLAPDGQIVVAYPFSAVPTRHRVRIFPEPATGSPDLSSADADGVDVYAMCAIDALGIAPMLGQHTLIESIDRTTGQPIKVTTTTSSRAGGGQVVWEPASAVVFLGAEGADCARDSNHGDTTSGDSGDSDGSGGGRDACDPSPGMAGRPSADCCCGYLNFFTNRQTAKAWTEAHRHIPGQILDQAAAEALATRLFGHLLAD